MQTINRKGKFFMISYEPLWETMAERKVSKYQLVFHWGLSSNTIRRISRGEAINSTTLNDLCLILNCGVEDVLRFEATEEELERLEQKRKETRAKFSQKK